MLLIRQFLAHFHAVINSYSEIFFIQGIIPSILLLAISLLNPNAALCGLLSILSAYGFAIFIGYKKEFLSTGFFTYNPLLVGLAIGTLFLLSPITITLVAMGAILSLLLTILLADIFSKYFALQILSIPFIIVTSLIYLASSRFSNLYVMHLYTNTAPFELAFLPEFLQGFFKAMGAIIFMPDVLSGLLITLLILFSSRILFFLALSGFFIGVMIQGALTGSIHQAMTDISSFNYILIAMALGGIFLIPSPQSYLMAFIGVSISTLLISAVNVFWAQYGLPVFTLPFTIITLSFTYVLNLTNFRYRPLIYKSSPEQTLDYFLTNQHRYSPSAITLSLPFAGYWQVWQGFDGQWTHKGLWQHAYDFNLIGLDGKSYHSDGNRLEHYHCFKQQVLAPVQGRVIKVVNELPDNPIGVVDQINNWGNLVLIQDSRGYIVELSHFSQYSISVSEGDWIESGQYLGLCGNSGYSPQPHIHLQVQTNPQLGSPTQDFRFVHYIEDKGYRFYGLPTEQTAVCNAWTQPYYDQLTTFLLDSQYHYDVYRSGKFITEFSMQIQMAVDGTFYFQTKKAKLYFGKIESTFYAYHMEGDDPLLRYLFLALPSLPLHYETELSWQDSIPNSIMLTGIKRALANLISAFFPQLIKSTGDYQFISDHEITGHVRNDFFNVSKKTRIKLNTYSKFEQITYDNIEFKIKDG